MPNYNKYIMDCIYTLGRLSVIKEQANNNKVIAINYKKEQIKSVMDYIRSNIADYDESKNRFEDIERCLINVYGTQKGIHFANVLSNNLLNIFETKNEVDSPSRRTSLNKINNLLAYMLDTYNMLMDSLNNKELFKEENVYAGLGNKLINGEVLTENDIDTINGVIKNSSYDKQKQFNIMTSIFLKNNAHEKDQFLDQSLINIFELTTRKYSPLIINASFENKKYLDTVASSFNQVIDACTNRDELDSLLTIPKNLNILETKYIYESAYNHVISEINELKMAAIDDLLIEDNNERELTNVWYIRLLFKQKYLQLKLKQISLATKEETNDLDADNIAMEKEEVSNNFLESPKIILYSTIDYNNPESKSYIERDMKNIPEEYYYKVWELIDKLRKGNLLPKEYSYFTKYRKFYELKADQLRIVFYNASNNRVIITGLEQKKTTEDNLGMDRLTSRNIYLNADDAEYQKIMAYSIGAEERLRTLIETKGRVGTRNKVQVL